ncbi:hypothetical protein EOL73_02875 [Candidatus Saccharibacteria bacterium]|nr:hypothetical protein [Candidatus Saccharibacteria bacterium]
MEKKFHRVQLLDPAVGTATFLNETIKFIHEQFKGQEGRWPAYVADNLIHRLHGFELMMAPYTIAHLKLGMTLKETGVENLPDRLGVYLTNTLEEGVPRQQDLFSFGLAQAVSEESQHAAEIKSERPIMIVMGNPPYSGESSNNTPYANGLVDKYKVEPGGLQKLQERNYKWINNDYVKFLSFAENMITKNGNGIVAMITDNSYLESPTFRGMRWHLAKSFDKIYILNLHGNGQMKEVAPDGGKDENVFDILQGVAIIIAIKKTNLTSGDDAELYVDDIYGTRMAKFSKLADEPSWKKIPLEPRFMRFKKKIDEDSGEYDKYIGLKELFTNSSMGIQTHADSTVLAYTETDLEAQITQHGSSFDTEKSKVANYRPFDLRKYYDDPKIVQRPRSALANNMDSPNVALCFMKQYAYEVPYSYALASEYRTIDRVFISNKGAAYFAPLYLYHSDGTRDANFNKNELKKLNANLKKEPTSEDTFDYLYATLHSPQYRERYSEFLKTDFPRVPIPTQVDFDRLVPLGRALRELHLMKSPGIDDYGTVFPEAGSNIVEKIEFKPYLTEKVDGKVTNVEGWVYINDKQYFGNVPETAWNFYIGGYQPAQKWLKDRKGRALSNDELDHYQKIIKILLETDRIMKEIG